MASAMIVIGWRERAVIVAGFVGLLIVVNSAMFHRLNSHVVDVAPLQLQPEHPTKEFLAEFGIVMVAVADFLDDTKIRYIDWAMLSCQSIRMNGQYKGPIYLVTNYDITAKRYQKMLHMYSVSVIKVHVELSRLRANKMQGQRFKMLVGALVPDKIRYLLYIDADVLIGANLDRFLAMGSSYLETCTLVFFQGRNRATKPNQPFQGGTFFVDLKYGMPFMSAWERILFERSLPKDQIALYLASIDRLSQYSSDAIHELVHTIETNGEAAISVKWNGVVEHNILDESSVKKMWWDGVGDPPKTKELCVISHKRDWVLFPFPDTMRRGAKNDLNHITFTGFLKKVTEEELLKYLRDTLRLDPSGLSLYFPIPYENDLRKAAQRDRY